MKCLDLSDADRVARKYKQRTIHNWKRQYGFTVPVDLFDEFKRHKKYYTQIFVLNKDLVKLVAESPVPAEFQSDPKQRKD